MLPGEKDAACGLRLLDAVLAADALPAAVAVLPEPVLAGLESRVRVDPLAMVVSTLLLSEVWDVSIAPGCWRKK